MLHRLILALALAAGVSLVGPSAAQAQVFVVSSCAATGLNLPLGPGGRPVQQQDGLACVYGNTGGGGGGGSTGSVTAPGTNGTQAQAVQGINGGVPVGINALALPLPTGAATAANQNSTAAGTSATNAQGVQGVTGGVPLTSVAQDSFTPVGSPYSASATGVLFTVDTTGYQSVSVQLSGTFSATVTYEASNDNTNWYAALGTFATSPNIGVADGSAVIRVFPVYGRYFRARVSAYTSGTVVATPLLRSQPMVSPQTTATISGTVVLGTGTASFGSLGASAAANGIASFSRLPSSAATANLTAAKTSAGRAYLYQGCNTTASTIYMRLYNAAATGAVTVGTTTPFAGPYAFPPNTCIQATPFAADIGIYASAGLVYAFGTAPADNDTTTIGAGAIAAFQIGYQ